MSPSPIDKILIECVSSISTFQSGGASQYARPEKYIEQQTPLDATTKNEPAIIKVKFIPPKPYQQYWSCVQSLKVYLIFLPKI